MPGDHSEENPATAPPRRPRSADRRVGHRDDAPAADETLFGAAEDLNEQELNRLPKQTLLTIARSESLPNRSKMNKAQLARTLRKHLRKAR